MNYFFPIQFIFPTKTEVRVDFERYHGHHDLYITPSVEDYRNAEGICGYIQEDLSVVRRLRNGVVTTDSEEHAHDWWELYNY